MQEQPPLHLDIVQFTGKYLHRTLYHYQEQACRAILDSVIHQKGYTFTVMFARQMGKNEMSAILEAYLLLHYHEGSIIKVAPTFRPQIYHSYQRLLTILLSSQYARHVWFGEGSIIGVTAARHDFLHRRGSHIQFLSASKHAHVVGATASYLLEVDEAQDVSIEKFEIELLPMASTQNATTVLYGTAWNDQTLLAKVRAQNLELERQDGVQRHFEFDWRVLADINPGYKRFVENRIERQGEDHPSISTQFYLRPLFGGGGFFNQHYLQLLAGKHQWSEEPGEDECYIAGMDIGGEAHGLRNDASPVKRDSTVLTIGRVIYDQHNVMHLQIVHQCWWTGVAYTEQERATIDLCERWHIRQLVVDSTGMGDVIYARLREKLGETRVRGFHFTRAAKSELAYHLLGMLGAGRLTLYSERSAPTDITEECWKQMRLARQQLWPDEIINMYVDPADGHDDFLMSLALCVEGTRHLAAPIVQASIIRATRVRARQRFEGRY